MTKKASGERPVYQRHLMWKLEQIGMENAAKQTVFVSPRTDGYPDVIDEQDPSSGKGLWCGQSFDEMRVRYPNIEVRDLDLVIEQQEAMLRTAPCEINEADYNDALEALPPMNWVVLGRTQSFSFLERYSGRVTTIYAKVGDTYWSFRDVYTLTHSVIMEKVKEAIRQKTKGVPVTA